MSEQAERAVIGGLVLVDDNFTRAANVFSLVKPSSFRDPRHQAIASACQALVATKTPLDLLTIEGRLDKAGQLEQAGGLAYLAELAQTTPSAANIVHYAKLVRESAIVRFSRAKLVNAIDQIDNAPEKGSEEVLRGVQAALAEIMDHAQSGSAKGLRHVRDFASDWLDEVEKRFEGSSGTDGIKTGISSIDDLIAPQFIRPDALIVLGARPKMGKTTLLTRILANMAVHDEKPVAFFSLEMSNKAILQTMICNASGIDSGVFHAGGEKGDWDRIMPHFNSIVNSEFYTDDTPGITVDHVVNECRKLKAERTNLGAIAVDYLTLMEAGAAERNDLAYGAITKKLKGLAKEMQAPVFLITQLNRAVDNRTDKRPQPSDSRDTGQIEQDCDMWIGLYREAGYDAKCGHSVGEALIRLNRHGATGTAYFEMQNGIINSLDAEDAAKMIQQAKPEPAKPGAKNEPRTSFGGQHGKY